MIALFLIDLNSSFRSQNIQISPSFPDSKGQIEVE